MGEGSRAPAGYLGPVEGDSAPSGAAGRHGGPAAFSLAAPDDDAIAYEIAEEWENHLLELVEPKPRPYRIYMAAELDELPAAEWIIDQRIPRNAIVALIGAKGHKKTFTVIDLACHVATGLKWHGCTVKPGFVVYVYAEGPYGAKTRIDAWCEHNAKVSGLPLNRGELALGLLPRRVPVNDAGEVAALIAEIQGFANPPVLVIIDTLNMNLDGDEDGRGMGGFVAGCSRLRDTFGATVLVVHHTPLSSEDRGRGHTAFDGAIDTRLIVSCDADRVTLECTHQRNAADGWTVAYETVEIGGSLALKPSSPTGGDLKGQRRQLLEVVYREVPVSFTALQKASELKTSSFKKALKWLADKAYVKQANRKYEITDAGTLALRPLGLPDGYRG